MWRWVSPNWASLRGPLGVIWQQRSVTSLGVSKACSSPACPLVGGMSSSKSSRGGSQTTVDLEQTVRRELTLLKAAQQRPTIKRTQTLGREVDALTGASPNSLESHLLKEGLSLATMSQFLVLKDTWSQLVQSHLTVVHSSQDLDRVLVMIQRYRTKWQAMVQASNKTVLFDQPLYIRLLKLTALNGSWKHVHVIHDYLKQDWGGLNPSSGAAIAECVARISPTKKYLNYVLSLQAELAELDAQSVFQASNYATKVGQGLQIANPRFQPQPRPTYQPRRYESSILSALNERDDSSLQSQMSDIEYASQIQKLSRRQFKMELSGHQIIPSVLAVPVDRQVKKLVKDLLNQWSSSLEQTIESSYANPSQTPPSNPMSAPFLSNVSAPDLSQIILHVVVYLCKTSEHFSPPTKHLEDMLGTAVMIRSRMNELQKVHPESLVSQIEMLSKVYARYMTWFIRPQDQLCHREAFETIIHEWNADDLTLGSFKWAPQVRLAVGQELLNAIVHKLTINLDAGSNLCLNNRSFKIIGTNVKSRTQLGETKTFQAFYKVLRTRGKGRELEEVKPHPVLTSLFAIGKLSDLSFPVTELPMVVPPRPWVSDSSGGYLLHEVEMTRRPVEEAVETPRSPNTLLPTLDALNQLGSTPWIINKPILECIVEVFRHPKKYNAYLKRVGIPRHPEDIEPPSEAISKAKFRDMTRDQYTAFQQGQAQRQAYIQLKAESYSLWCDTLYRLSIAQHFQDRVLYFPHNIDFRGRVYPIPPYLNHMGCDLSRSLLVFAEGKPLGPKGLDWLKLHTVNLSGFKKKSSIRERMQYAEDNLSLFLDSASDPFGGKKWWLESEEPWQTLGACIELRNALSSSDPTNYISHLPIHQDGSCNGLQHYAAMGRDSLGAKFVNLIPSECPQDVYGEIASILERKRSEDAQAGNPIAILLNGAIQRKVIKQTVMTTVYGVTKYGAKLQIAKQLKDIENPIIPSDKLGEASVYLAHRTFDSLNEMFESSQKIQNWFISCADMISTDFFRFVEWETPLGLACVQSYQKPLHSKNLPLGLRSLARKPNTSKQRNGFPPNFVHSLDSSHMMLTALHMWRRGCTYASVHDCFWTHPATVEIMNEVCRQQFINLHSYPILEELSEAFLQNYINEDTKQKLDPVQLAKAEQTFRAVPKKGDLDLAVVKHSTFFFS
uniref:DNA-directed RNA polymerase n=1 Tax=Tigriopus californicus TaxID=6832 RepID=Q2PZ44_TIGCA|nr:mitochondrial RNA polymerase [Tigriopus californicus]